MDPMQKCFKGPINRGSSGRCIFDQYSAYANTKQEATYIRASILNSATPSCWVEPDPNFPKEFPTSLPVLREHSSNWSKVAQVGDATGMYFDFPKRHCFAYYTLGRAWRSGYKSSARGFVCEALGKAPLTTAQIEAFLTSVHVRSQ